MQEADRSIEINLPRCDGSKKRARAPRPGRLITESTDYLSYHINRYLLHRPGRTATEEGKGNEEEFSGWSVSSIREERRTTAGGGDEEGMDDSPIRGFWKSKNSRRCRRRLVSKYISQQRKRKFIYIYVAIYMCIYINI